MKSPIAPPDTSRPNEETFEAVVIPHLDAGYRLARWIMQNDHDAEDVVQEASLRAFRYFRTFTGGNGRAWFLRIVRNTCHDWRGRQQHVTDLFDEERHSDTSPTADPEVLLRRTDAASAIERALEQLPHRAREVFVLREIDGLSYRQLAAAMDMPIGTVMSSLSRARQAFRGAYGGLADKPARRATRVSEHQEERDVVLA
jgi:RNA polymerase sigma-70 factor (ECF subfamily)